MVGPWPALAELCRLSCQRATSGGVVVACAFHDARWSTSTPMRAYEVQILKHLKRDTKHDEERISHMASAQLRSLAMYGYCVEAPVNATLFAQHPALAGRHHGEVLARTGFVCRVDRERAELVATFSSADGAVPETSLVDERTSEATLMANAIPVRVKLGLSRPYLRLNVDVADVVVVYPVVSVWPGGCASVACHPGRVHRRFDPFEAREHMCLAEVCTEEDEARCCEARAACDTYSMSCPRGQATREDGSRVLCFAAECTLHDQATCCAPSTTPRPGGAPADGSAGAATAGASMPQGGSVPTRHGASEASTSGPEGATAGSSEVAAGPSARPTWSPTASTTATLEPIVCTESGTVWLPLDLAGTAPTIAENSAACQARCVATERCEHFSFWSAHRHCHLQGAEARRQEYGFGFESGPPECSPENAVSTTTTDPLAFNDHCLQRGMYWAPLMPEVLYIREEPEQEGIRLCQRFCAKTGCARFQYDSRSGGCNVAGPRAKPYFGAAQDVISGPASCGGVYSELSDFLMLKYSRAARDAIVPSPMSARLGGIALFAAVAAAVALSLKSTGAARYVACEVVLLERPAAEERSRT